MVAVQGMDMVAVVAVVVGLWATGQEHDRLLEKSVGVELRGFGKARPLCVL